MNKCDAARLAMAVAVLGETYGRQVSDITIRAYEMGLAGLTIEVIESAVATASRRCRFMPTPSELRELAGELSPADRAIRAWNVVTRALKLHAYYESVDFDDPCVNATIRSLGGWERLDERFDTDDVKWIRKDFDAIYKSFATHGFSAEAAAPLAGYCDRQNHALGHDDAIRKPIAIACNLPPHGPGIVGPERNRIRHETERIGGIPE